MAKQLNSESGKGYLVSKGQAWVEEYLTTHTQKELAELAGYISKGEPNAGAVSVALKSLGWASFNGQSSVVTEKKASSALCPGRVEGFVSAFAEGDTVTPADVESVVLADGVKWNQLVLKMDEKELAMLAKFLKSGGYSQCPRVSQRAEFERAENERLALIEANIDAAQTALYAIDAELATDAGVLKAIRAYYS